MGFFTGRVTCTRFRVSGDRPGQFGPDHLEKLADHAVGTQRVAKGDGSIAGWIAGDHILDTRFDLAKNIVNDTLHFALRIDETKIPNDLLRAYTQVELNALASQNPSGMPSMKQKREAKQLARERLETEASDGRFTRRKSFPLLWDGLSNELWVGTTSVTAIDRLITLFSETFDRKFEMLAAGTQAFALSEIENRTRQIDDAKPTAFVPSHTHEVAWVADETNRDFLGNEFLLWLWYYLEKESDSVGLNDGSEATVMITKSLMLECPRGQTGRETISSDGPTRLPETHRAIQAGKLPRKMGLIVVRQDEQYELAIQAESLAISGAKLPPVEGDQDRARLEDRVTQLRHLMETLDLLYFAFLQMRFTDNWSRVIAKMKKWLHTEGREKESA